VKRKEKERRKREKVLVVFLGKIFNVIIAGINCLKKSVTVVLLLVGLRLEHLTMPNNIIMSTVHLVKTLSTYLDV